MSDQTRRGFLGTAVVSGLAGERAAEAVVEGRAQDVAGRMGEGDRELPAFRFALEASEARVLGGNSAREATARQLPISKGIAGVSMRLEPGGLRELHWHADADEWAFVVDGRCRTTMVDPLGNSETNDFGPGDVWYFPRGHGHSVQGLGPGPCHVILVFDNGDATEFGTFSITDWIGHTPKEILSKNLGLPAEAFARFPRSEAYFVRGAVPPAMPAPPLRGVWKPPAESYKFPMLEQEPHSVHSGGNEWRLGADSFPISRSITGVILDLVPGGLRELHWHPDADEWQYLITGKVRVSLFGARGRHRAETLGKGDVAYIPRGHGHFIENASGTEPARVLIALNSGHYQAIDLSEWFASNPSPLLAAHFGVPESVIEAFPRHRVFVAPKEGPATSPDGRDLFPDVVPDTR